jgi:hypothetical protein
MRKPPTLGAFLGEAPAPPVAQSPEQMEAIARQWAAVTGA